MRAGAHLPQLRRDGDLKKTKKQKKNINNLMTALMLGEQTGKCLLSFLLGQEGFCEEEIRTNTKSSRCTSGSLTQSCSECWSSKQETCTGRHRQLCCGEKMAGERRREIT